MIGLMSATSSGDARGRLGAPAKPTRASPGARSRLRGGGLSSAPVPGACPREVLVVLGHFKRLRGGRRGGLVWRGLGFQAIGRRKGHIDPAQELFANVFLIEVGRRAAEIFVEPIDRFELFLGDFAERQLQRGREPCGLNETMVPRGLVLTPQGLDHDLAHPLVTMPSSRAISS